MIYVSLIKRDDIVHNMLTHIERLANERILHRNVKYMKFREKARVGKFLYISNVIEIKIKILFKVLFKLQIYSVGVKEALQNAV